MNATDTTPRPATTRNDDGLAHIYLPWSAMLTGLPPAGARALCGHVRSTETPVEVVGSGPGECVVCTDLAKGLGR